MGKAAESITAVVQLALLVAMVAAVGVAIWTPKGWVHWQWAALGTDKPVVAFECLDSWRKVFNDPDAVYVYAAEVIQADGYHVVDVEVRGKNKMGAWVRGDVSCALKPDSSIDAQATLMMRLQKMERPEDGQVPP